MHNKQHADSCEIPTGRWSKCNSMKLWRQSCLGTRQYWHWQCTWESFCRRVIWVSTVMTLGLSLCARSWQFVLVCTSNFSFLCQSRRRRGKWKEVGICAIFRRNFTWGGDWQRTTMLFSDMVNGRWNRLCYQIQSKSLWYKWGWWMVRVRHTFFDRFFFSDCARKVLCSAIRSKNILASAHTWCGLAS